MIFNLLAPFAEGFPLFNLIRYTTFRAGAACLTALIIALFFGPAIIRWLRAKQRGGRTEAVERVGALERFHFRMQIVRLYVFFF